MAAMDGISASLDAFYVSVLHDTPKDQFWGTIFPALLTLVLPLLCVIYAHISCIPSGLVAQPYPPPMPWRQQNAGTRAVRRVMHAVQADIRLMKSTSSPGSKKMLSAASKV